MNHHSNLRVRVGDLVPGSYVRSNSYFPRFNWDVIEETYDFIDRNPDVESTRWPLYPMWKDWVLLRFRHIPTEKDTLTSGKLWSWNYWEAGYRRIHKSFNEFGYCPEKTGGGEQYAVVIEQHGEICVIQGNKRIAMLRRLKGLDFKINVLVNTRHQEWINTKQDLYNLAGGKYDLYQPLDHPDLMEWTISQPCVERMGMIDGVLTPKFNGTVLDIGCHTGWFVRQFARRNQIAVGIDSNDLLLNIAKDLAQFRNDGKPLGTYVSSDVLEFLTVNKTHYDVCLCLSIIMHLFGRSPSTAWKVLELISEYCKMMFLDCVWGGYSNVLPFTERTIQQEIIRHTRYCRSKLLGRTKHENRPFYVFNR